MEITAVIRLNDSSNRGRVLLKCGCAVKVLDYRQFQVGATMPCPKHERECFVPLPAKPN